MTESTLQGRTRIPVAQPVFAGNEARYVADCVESGWVSSNGPYIAKFEQAFASWCGVRHALTCANGTAALHLLLMAHGVGPGDQVLVPSLTYIATANAVRYCGAEPVLVDSEPRTWNIDPAALEACIGPRTKGIIVVHLYGHSADMDPIMAIAREHGLFVVEDAAEAHGASYKGRKVGTLGDSASFSFFGNKVMTTGEGGMVVTNDSALADRVRLLKGQGMDPHRRYWFPVVGYNYRMTNIQAALGLAQLERIDALLQARRDVAAGYQRGLAGLADRLELHNESSWAHHIYWMFNVLLRDGDAHDRDALMAKLDSDGIETRPVFYPMHCMPPYQDDSGRYPVADRVGSRGLSLPTHAALTEADVAYICERLAHHLATRP